MNKKGKGNMWIGITAVSVILLLGVIAVGIFMQQPVQQTTYTPQGTPTGTGGTTINTVNPAISIAGADIQKSGTAVTTTGSMYATNNGDFASVTLGTTTAVPGQVVDLFLVNNTLYHNLYIGGISVTPSTFPISAKFNKNATVTQNIYGTTGLVLGNGDGSKNQTSLGAGTTYNLKDEMTASSLTSTQDMVCIIEVQNGTAIDTSAGGVKYGGQAAYSTAKPSWYSLIGSNSGVYLFNVPALATTETVARTISLPTKSTIDLSSTSWVYRTCYTKEWNIDPSSGKAQFTVEDSNGNLESMASYVYKIQFI